MKIETPIYQRKNGFIEFTNGDTGLRFSVGHDLPDLLAEVQQFIKDHSITPETHPDDTEPIIDLSTFQSDLCIQVESKKDALMYHGFEYQGGSIQADSEAQANLMAWVLLDTKGSLTYPRQWRRSDNTFLAIADSAGLLTLAAAMADYKDRVYTSIFIAKDSIRAAKTVEAAQGIYDAWNASL